MNMAVFEEIYEDNKLLNKSYVVLFTYIAYITHYLYLYLFPLPYRAEPCVHFYTFTLLLPFTFQGWALYA